MFPQSFKSVLFPYFHASCYYTVLGFLLLKVDSESSMHSVIF